MILKKTLPLFMAIAATIQGGDCEDCNGPTQEYSNNYTGSCGGFSASCSSYDVYISCSNGSTISSWTEYCSYQDGSSYATCFNFGGGCV